MEALFLLSRLPSLKGEDQALFKAFEIFQELIDHLTKKNISERLQCQLILLAEIPKLITAIKYRQKDQRSLEPNEETRKQYLGYIIRIIRPFFYILAIILWGRKSWKPFITCLIGDFLSDKPRWELYLFRYPIYDKVLARLLPRLLRKSTDLYQNFLSCVI